MRRRIRACLLPAKTGFSPSTISPSGFETSSGFAVEGQDVFIYCLTAHLIEDYLQRRADFEKWPYAMMGNVIAEAHSTTRTADFGRVIGSHCHKQAAGRKPASTLRESLCNLQCPFGYEGSILAKDPVPHNRMVDLLKSSEYGSRFYQELVILGVTFLRSCLPPDAEVHLRDVAVCYMMQKLEVLRLPMPLRREVVGRFAGIVS